MIFHLILALFFLQTCALHAALPSQALNIFKEAVAWDEKFGCHVKNDTGYKYFASLLHTNDPAFNHFEEVDICSLFSKLRCATCFAMVLDSNVREDVFNQALKICHDAEIYQIFVAADSYYKGQENSKKFQKLQKMALHLQDPPGEPHTHALLANHTPDIFQQQLPWLQKWIDARDQLESFLCSNVAQLIDVFVHLVHLFKRNPYVLGHIQKSDFQQHAHVLVPALLKEDNLGDFMRIVQESYPCGAKKDELISFLHELADLLPLPHSLEAHNNRLLQTYCMSLTNGIWKIFQSLNAHITQDQWSLCVAYLRFNHEWVDDSFKRNSIWLMEVFQYKALPAVALSSTTDFNYYKQHHAPYIFQKHALVVHAICKPLDEYCTSNEKELCQYWKQNAQDNSQPFHYDFNFRNSALNQLLTLRCRILWRLAKVEPLTPGFLPLHSTCSYAEKKALCLNVQQEKCAETPGMKILKNVVLPSPTENLSRLYIARSLQ